MQQDCYALVMIPDFLHMHILLSRNFSYVIVPN